jgi:hypothetical protein
MIPCAGWPLLAGSISADKIANLPKRSKWRSTPCVTTRAGCYGGPQMDNRVNVIKRNRAGRLIDFECPTCQKPIGLGPTSLTEIEAGGRVLRWCRGCLSNTTISLASLGDFLWAKE